MKFVHFFTALLFVGLFSSMASARPSTTSLTCSEAKELVNSHGAIVLNTAPGIFDRYVRDGSFCMGGETTEPAWVPTSNDGQCFIGYVCRQHQSD